MLIAALAAGLLLAQAAQPAAPAPPAGQPTTVSEVKAKPKRKMVCQTETSTDSFIAKRVCRTPEEVEALRKAGREQVKATQDFYQECRGRSC
jgi:hypothetical protein